MTQKITRLRLVIDLDANENPSEIHRVVYRQEDDAMPGVRTNAQGKGDIGPAETMPQSSGTVDLAGLLAEATPADMFAALVAAAKADAGL